MASEMARARLVGLNAATLSVTAARTTAAATWADSARRCRAPGSSGAPGLDASACSATAAAAARSIRGVTRAARDTTVPRPMPGKMSALSSRAMANVAPACSAGAVAIAVATSARPSDHAMISAGVAAIRAAGTAAGRISGLPVARHMAPTTCGVNAWPAAEVPSRMVGSVWAMTVASPAGLGPAAQPAADRFFA